MKISDKMVLLYFTICIILAGFFAFFGYAIDGTGSDIPKAIVYFCLYMLWLLIPYVIICLVVETIKSFKAWKLINLIVMLLVALVYYFKF